MAKDKNTGTEIPPVLFKYFPALPENRPSFLENQMVRYTQPSDLNDPLEFSLGFERLLGSKFERFFAEKFLDILDPEFLYQEGVKRGVISKDFKKEEAILILRANIENASPAIVAQLANPREAFGENFFDAYNSTLQQSDITDRFGIFSLSADAKNPPMWAHYSSNYCGYVVGLDTAHEYFKFTKADGVALFEVIYENTILSEFMDHIDDPKNILARKRSEWAYEKEWRHIRERTECDVSLELDRISLFKIPVEAVTCIIKSERADQKLNEQVERFKLEHNTSLEIGVISHDWQTGTIQIEGIQSLSN